MATKLIGITGGTGFLGRHLVPLLINQGHRVRLLARPTSDVSWLPGPPLELVYGDVTDSDSVVRFVKGCDDVIHAAGYFRLWGPPARFNRINIAGSVNVARAALRSGVRRLVHISTLAVVGVPPSDGWIHEDTPCHPQDAYQRSKYAAEQRLSELTESRELQVVILRPCAFYGPYSRYGFNRLFIEDPMRGLRIQVDGGQRITFPVYVPDVCRAVCMALQQGRPGSVYNIGDEPVTHAQVNQIVAELLGERRNYRAIPGKLMFALAGLMELRARISGREPFYPLNLRYYVFKDWRVCTEKARTELGFVPTPLSHGLKETIAWYQTFDRSPEPR